MIADADPEDPSQSMLLSLLRLLSPIRPFIALDRMVFEFILALDWIAIMKRLWWRTVRRAQKKLCASSHGTVAVTDAQVHAYICQYLYSTVVII